MKRCEFRCLELNNTYQYTVFSVFFTSWVISGTITRCAKISEFRLFVFYWHISFKITHGGHISGWLFGGLTLNQGKLLGVSCGGLQVHLWSSEMVASSQTEKKEWMKSDPRSLAPRDATLCSVCYLLSYTVCLAFSFLPPAGLIVLHAWFVPCSEPLVVKLLCLSFFRSLLICCSVSPWPIGQDSVG